MRYRKLSADGDYTFGQGQSNFYIDVPDAVGQAAKTRLLLMAGEWFLDVEEGTPYGTDILGAHTQATRDDAVKNRIMKTEGFLRLAAYQSLVSGRNFSVQAVIDTIYGETPVEVVF